MNSLFMFRDKSLAREGWTKRFETAKTSGIPRLERFARIKEKRIEGLIFHASYPISTSKLEGLNNKTKVIKRVGYGYRDDEYFFSMIRYLSIPDRECNIICVKSR